MEPKDSKIKNENERILPQALLENLKYLAQREGIGQLEMLGRWQSNSKKDKAKEKEILDLYEEKAKQTTSGERFRISVKIDKLLIKFLDLSEIGPEFREILEPKWHDTIGQIIDHFGALVLPYDLQIDLNDPEGTEAKLQQYLRDLENKTKH
jgi:hypothetical protein